MVWADPLITVLFIISLIAVLIIGVLSKNPWKQISLIFSLYFALVAMILWLNFYNVNAWLPTFVAGSFILYLAYLISSKKSVRKKASLKESLGISFGVVAIILLLGLLVSFFVPPPPQYSMGEDLFLIQDINSINILSKEVRAPTKPLTYGSVDVYVELSFDKIITKRSSLSKLLYGSKEKMKEYYSKYPFCLYFEFSNQDPVIVAPYVTLNEDKLHLTYTHYFSSINGNATLVKKVSLYLYDKEKAALSDFYCGSPLSKYPSKVIDLWP